MVIGGFGMVAPVQGGIGASKDELIGEIIGLLQSPAKNVVSALQSSGGTLSGIIKTLSEKEA